MSFTDQKRRIATKEDCSALWNGQKNGEAFRCYLCGHRFAPGDGWRWVYTGGIYYERDGKRFGVTNLMTCDACDGDDVISRWVDLNQSYWKDAKTKYWAIR